jgi:predicted ribosomally synthesized peptide with SipW-like signal peptide
MFKADVKKLALSVGLLGATAAAVTMGTLAVFTDSQPIGANTFTTGTVDISTAPTTALVTYANMAPGDTVTNSIVVTNSGSLNLRYAVSSTATNTDAKALKDQLVLTVKTIDVTTPGTPCDNFDGTTLYTGDLDSTAGKIIGDTAQGGQAGDRTLNTGTNETLCFKADLPLASGDTFQNATTTATFTFAAEQTKNNP